MALKELESLGFSYTEAKTYLALIRLGSASAGQITKVSELNRSNVYDALERLIEKGLASFVLSGSKKVFSPADPEQLKGLLAEKQDTLNSILPELKKQFSSFVEDSAFVFRGRKGIKAVFEQVLSDNNNLFAFGAESMFTEHFPIYQKQWNARRVGQGLKIKMIFNEKVRSKRKESLGLIEVKYLPESYDFPSTTLVFGDKTAIVSWSKEPFAFLIKSREVAKSNMNFFNILWKGAKR